jgi:hypothetical protein
MAACLVGCASAIGTDQRRRFSDGRVGNRRRQINNRSALVGKAHYRTRTSAYLKVVPVTTSRHPA